MNAEQCRAARAILGITQPELAKLARVSENTLREFEGGKRTPIRGSVQKLRAALVVSGIEFLSDADGFGVRKNAYSLGEHPVTVRPKKESQIFSESELQPAQCRAARGFLKWSQSEAAAALGVGLSMLVGFENGTRPQRQNLERIKAGFELAGVAFTAEASRLSVSIEADNRRADPQSCSSA
jgi:transcriptional regulator with XRE-family HTH domain